MLNCHYIWLWNHQNGRILIHVHDILLSICHLTSECFNAPIQLGEQFCHLNVVTLLKPNIWHRQNLCKICHYLAIFGTILDVPSIDCTILWLWVEQHFKPGIEYPWIDRGLYDSTIIENEHRKKGQKSFSFIIYTMLETISTQQWSVNPWYLLICMHHIRVFVYGRSFEVCGIFSRNVSLT